MTLVGEELWWLLFASWLLAVVSFDGIWRRVPNACLLAALATQAFFLFGRSVFAGPLLWPGASGWGQAIAGFGIGLAFIVFWFAAVMGAGDVKFLAVLGAWTGVRPFLGILIIASLLAFAHVLVQLFRLSRPLSEGTTAANFRARVRGTPYAAYLALAALSLALTQWNSPSCSWFSSLCSMG